MEQLKGSFDKDFGERSRHKSPLLKFKLIIDKDQLTFIERWELNALGDWENSNFDFPEDYIFKRTK